MTETTTQYLEIRTLADVEAIDPSTDNRYAVRSLRHAADSAIKQSAKLKRMAESGTFSDEIPSVRCAANSAAGWREALERAKAALDAGDVDPAERKAALLAESAEQRTLASACLGRAIDILDAHASVNAAADAEAADEADEDEDDEEDDEDD